MPGFSVAQAFVVVMYFYAMVYAVFFQSNIITDSNRTGWIAVSQLPLVFAFAQKNNVVGGLLGYGYEKVLFTVRKILDMVTKSYQVEFSASVRRQDCCVYSEYPHLPLG